MIGLLGAKIWKENGVDFGNPVNLVPLAAGIIIAIGDTSLEFTDDFVLVRHRARHDRDHRRLPPGPGDRARHMLRVGEPGTMIVGRASRACTRSRTTRRTARGPDTLTPTLIRERLPAREACPVRLPPPSERSTRPSTLLAATGRQGARRRAEPGAAHVDAARRARRTLVDINHVPGSDGIEVDDGGVRIGALDAAPRARARRGGVRRQPAAARRRCSTSRTRRSATAARRSGSLVHADPAAEMPAVLLPARRHRSRPSSAARGRAHDRGRRTSSSARWSRRCEPDELAVSRDVPATRRPAPARAWVELARRHGDYALVGVGALVHARPATVTRRGAAVALISVGARPRSSST